ncbi:ABC transporter permease [Bacteroidota bacterium]
MYKRISGIKRKFLPFVAFVIIVSLWLILDYLLQIKSILVPNPYEIFLSISANFPLLLKHTSITMFESVMGFVIGSSLGFMIASIFALNKTIKDALYPYAIALKATPMLVIAPILVIWFGSGITSKIVMASLISFFPVLVNSYNGLTTLNQESLDLFNSMKANKWQLYYKLQVPSALPFIFSSLKIASTFAVVGATIAEFTGSSYGIGHLIINSSYYLETDLVFASIVAISLVGVAFFYLIEYTEKKIIYWL